MRAFLLTLMLIFLFSGFAFAEMRPPHNENSDSVFVKDSVSVCNDKSVENKQKKQLLLPIVLLGAALILTCGVLTVDFEGSGVSGANSDLSAL